MFKKTKLTIHSYDTFFEVDGPPTRRANLLNRMLVGMDVLDTLPKGTWECKIVWNWWNSKVVVTPLD